MVCGFHQLEFLETKNSFRQLKHFHSEVGNEDGCQSWGIYHISTTKLMCLLQMTHFPHECGHAAMLGHSFTNYMSIIFQCKHLNMKSSTCAIGSMARVSVCRAGQQLNVLPSSISEMFPLCCELLPHNLNLSCLKF